MTESNLHPTWPSLLVAALAAAIGCAPGSGDSGTSGGAVVTQQQDLSGAGVPVNGFPNWDERTLLVLVNRDRADPQTALAGCAPGDCPDSPCYSAVPPVGWDYDLNRSSRFHSTNLVAAHSGLQHPSPCLLKPGFAQAYPATCDASPSCACQGPVICDCTRGCSCDSSLSSCVTQPFERIQAFNPNGCSENVAAGYPDPVSVESGFLLERCSCCTSTCPAQYTTCSDGVNGHRVNILSGGNTLLGTGEAPNGSLGCYQANWYTQDYGCNVLPPTKVVAGTHYPQSGTTFTFWANWFDTTDAAVARVVIDGMIFVMTHDRGTTVGNTTYAYQRTLNSGCHTYSFEFKDSASMTYTLPSVGAYLAGDSCTADYTTTTGGTTSGGSSGSTGGTTSGSGTGSTSGGVTVIPDAGLGLVVSSGCACSSSGSNGTPGALLVGLAALLLRRRRER